MFYGRNIKGPKKLLVQIIRTSHENIFRKPNIHEMAERGGDRKHCEIIPFHTLASKFTLIVFGKLVSLFMFEI